EFDTVDVTNLQRQVLYGHGDLDRPKLEVAADRLRDLNPHIRIVSHAERLEMDNVLRLIEDYDLVLDGSDNFPTRYLVNDACVIAAKPLVWGAVLRFEGQLSVFGVEGGPCYRCLFPEPPPPGTVPSCAEGGVFGVLPGVIGTLQATEAIKHILGRGDGLAGRFLVYDALKLSFRELRLPKNPTCPTCSEGARPELAVYDASCVIEESPEMTTNSETPDVPFEIEFEQLKAWRDAGHDHALLDVREPNEFEICRIEGAELMPMRSVPARLAELDRERLLVVQCHHGGRSAQIVQFLRTQGFTKVTNLGGGIDAWSLRIDASVPRY
ncbi:MAG: ThiF family adenylyltransferase, partial [Acidobacteriota bacterium]